MLGDGLDLATQLGPLVSTSHAARVKNYIALSVEQGATLITGGHSLERPGHFLQPTIFPDKRLEMAIVHEEVLVR